MSLLDIDQLYTFVVIAETGSFTEAATVVNRTQSAVSMQMKRLEETVGRPIFVRDGRKSRLTDDGARLLVYGRRVLALNAEAIAAFSDEALSGTVRIGLPDDYAPRFLPSLLAAFERSHSHLEIEVACIQTAYIIKGIRDGSIDLGLITNGDCGGFGAIVRREPLYWVGADPHTVYLADPLPLAIGPSDCSWRHDALAALDRIGRRHRVAYTSPSAAAITGAVVAGLAVGVLPESALTTEMRILGAREGLPPLPPTDIALVRAAHAHEPLHDALADHIVTSLGNLSAVAAE